MISQDTLTRGLRTDDFETTSLDQSSSFVLNGTYDNVDGDSFKVQNEEGNQYIYSAPYTIIGTINIGRRKTIVFSGGVENQSEIGIAEDDKYTTLINDIDLRFSTDHPIKGLYKTLNGCETYVYFHDGVNPDRVVNIDRLDEYKNPDGTWDIEKLRLQSTEQIPFVRPVEVLEGQGELEIGKYYFVAEMIDKNLNSIQKSIVSEGVNIYSTTQLTFYDKIVGGENISNTLPIDGGVPKTSKSIEIDISSISDYPFFKLYVIIYKTGDGLTPSVYELGNVIPKNGVVTKYIFRGINPNTDIQSDLAKVTTRDPVWTTSQDMKIVQNRLVRANLRGLADIDYVDFQKAANEIKIRPIRKTISNNDLSESNNPKNPIDNASFQAGEVYAFGITYFFKQGFYSPVFHIPGRAPKSFEKDLIPIEELDPFGVGEGELEYWKYQKYEFNSLNNEMAYYETSAKYPNIQCGTKSLYSYLTGQNIRHHKFPDLTYNNPLHDNEGNLYVYGIEWDNVTYPHPDIVGYKILYGKRDDLNRTVVDTIFYSTGKVNSQHLIYNKINVYSIPDIPLFPKASTLTNVFSPKTLVNDISGAGKYIEQCYYLVPEISDLFTNKDEKTQEEIDIIVDTRKFDYLTNPVRDPNFFIEYGNYRFRIQSSVKLNVNDAILGGQYPNIYTTDIVNESRYNKINLNFLTRELNYLEGIPSDSDLQKEFFLRVGLLKQVNFDVHSNLYAINYLSLSNGMSTNSFGQSYSGDVYVQRMSINSVYDVYDEDEPEYRISGYLFKDLVTCSEINFSLRHGGTTSTSSIYLGYNEKDYNSFVLSKFGDVTDTGFYSEDPKPFQYFYNEDFSSVNPNTYVALPQFYNYCSNCIGYYPNHIVWSDKQFIESINDEFRTYLNENYTIVGEDTGEISGLYYDGKTLWVHTWESLYALYPNPQQLQTDVNTVYLGTGDFLAIPPSQFSKTDYGYAGSQGRFAQCDTEFGRVYVDGDNGTVFLISQGVQELSSAKFGNQKFLRNNLPFALPKELHQYVSTDSIVSGVGIKCTYDPFHKRVIIYKRDYFPINYVGILEEVTKGEYATITGLYYSTRYKFFIFIDANTQEKTFVKLGNPDYFENRSFSISFSFDLMAWASFHSWLPSWTFNDAMHIYSCQGKDVWRHDSKTFNTFFNEPHSFIIEFVATAQNLEPSDIDHVDYYAHTRQWVEGTKTWARSIFPTFDKMIVYTDNQSTGELFLTGKQDHFRFFSGAQATVAYATDHYRVNQIYNMAIGSIVFTSDWNSIKGQYFIDKVPIGINPNLSQYYLAPIKSRYWKVRLFYSSSSKIIVDLIRTLHRNRSL